MTDLAVAVAARLGRTQRLPVKPLPLPPPDLTGQCPPPPSSRPAARTAVVSDEGGMKPLQQEMPIRPGMGGGYFNPLECARPEGARRQRKLGEITADFAVHWALPRAPR